MKVLIIKASAWGDIIHTFPAIHFLREMIPDVQIDWVVEERCKDLIAAYPSICRILVINTKKWRKDLFSLETWKSLVAFLSDLRQVEYDLVFDFQGNTKSGLITGLARGKHKVGFGFKTISERLSLLFTKQKADPAPHQNVRLEYLTLVEAWAQKKAQDLSLTLLNLTREEKRELMEWKERKAPLANIMVCPGSNWPNKRLTPSVFSEFLQRINRPQGFKFWLIYGTEEEEKMCHQLASSLNEAEVCTKMSLPLLQHWMREMDHVIAMDSLPLHLAGETGVPTFSIFGASSANKYRPIGSMHYAFQGSCPYGREFERRCPILRTCPTGACIRDLSVDAIVDHYDQFCCK